GRVLGHNASALVQKGIGLGAGASALIQKGIDLGLRHVMIPFMETHAGEVLKYGVDLGLRTWGAFLKKFGWRADQLDRVICHQVGAGGPAAGRKAGGSPPGEGVSALQILGNTGPLPPPRTPPPLEERAVVRPAHA